MNMLADAGTRRHHAGVNEPPRSLELLVVSERLQAASLEIRRLQNQLGEDISPENVET